MNIAVSALIVGSAVVASACVETIASEVRISGFVAESDGAPCRLSLSPTVNYSGGANDREIRGQFSEQFTVQPRHREFLATVRCGNVVRVAKTIQYGELNGQPYDLGRIAR